MTTSDIIQIVVTVGIVQILTDLFFNWYIFYQPPYQRALVTVQRTKYKLQQYQQQLQTQQVIAEEKAVGTKTTNETRNKKNTTSKGSAAPTTATTTSSSSSSGAMKKKIEKNTKKYQILENDYKEAVGAVASHHISPNVISTLLFVIVLRILSTEYYGNVVAVLPFEPIPFVRRLTHRGLNFGLSNVKELSDLLVLVPTTVAISTAETIVTTTVISDDASSQSDEGNNNKEDGKEGKKSKAYVRSAAQACSFMVLYVLSTISVKFYIHKLIGVQPPNDSQGLFSILESTSGQRLLRAATGMDANEILENLK